MLSRRFRPVAVVAVATIALLMLVRGWGYGTAVPRPFDLPSPLVKGSGTTVVHDDDGADYSQAEKLIVDTMPGPNDPPPEKPDGAADTKPDDGMYFKEGDIFHDSPEDLVPSSTVDDLSPSETVSNSALDDETTSTSISDAVTPAALTEAPPSTTTPAVASNVTPAVASETTVPVEGGTVTTSLAGSQSSPTSDDVLFSTEDVDWSRFAYTQYVTNSEYLCNSVMIFETLHRLDSKPDRVMMYPEHMLGDPAATTAEDSNGRLLIKARVQYGAKLVPIKVQHRDGRLDADNTWDDSYTKLLAFNQTQYDRVLSLDSDSVVMQPMDELFLLPPAPVAAPRAYWLLRGDPPQHILSSQVVLLQPDSTEFERVMEQTNAAGDDEYDMEIVNKLYLDSAFILPHRKYDLLTGEFRGDNHEMYLGSDREEWDPVAIFNEAKFIHFSDWPVPKPWIPMGEAIREEQQPKCKKLKNGQEDCTEREIWNGIYNDFTIKRADVCHAPRKPSKKKGAKENRLPRTELSPHSS